MATKKIKTESLMEKSWVELCEEEEQASLKEASNASINTDNEKCVLEIKKEVIDDTDENVTYTFENVVVKAEIKVEKEDVVPKRIVSYANAVKCSPVNGTNSKISVKETENCSIYTPSKDEFPECSSTEKNRRVTRRKIQKDFLQEDISLSSHLDVFHMVSPCKPETVKDEEMASPVKDVRVTRTAKRRINCNLLTSDNVKHSASDDVLMPSPKKVTRSSVKSARMAVEFQTTTRKRMRDSSSGNSRSNSGENRKEFAVETDEAILARRQKQIDYGKNTIGYERYRQLVPKEKRDKKHPHTPPKHRKYSRRAWDGLVRVWRQRLHFWDPPSQGGGNPDLLDFTSSLSDVSNCDSASVSSANSQSSTPWKENKRRVRVKHESASSSGSSSNELNENDDCVPLDSL